jgi:hypothetical protein
LIRVSSPVFGLRPGRGALSRNWKTPKPGKFHGITPFEGQPHLIGKGIHPICVLTEGIAGICGDLADARRIHFMAPGQN